MSSPRSSTPSPMGASPPNPRLGRRASPEASRRRALKLVGVVALGLGVYFTWRTLSRFPPDTTPEGAYLRIAVNIDDGHPRGCFAYLEDQAQHAAYSIRDYRKQASDKIAA